VELDVAGRTNGERFFLWTTAAAVRQRRHTATVDGGS
jgi:hypothetical protein